MVLTKIDHDSHEHMLTLKCDKTSYICHGCHEIGFGSRYGCMPCNYHLHKDCALATPYTFHPFFEGCNFKFFTRPPGKVERCCDACGGNVQGFVYHCEKCGNDLHPCCAQLPRVIGDDEMKLHLHHKVESNCHRCGPKKVRKKGRSWSYVSTCKKYCFHVSCVKDMLVREREKQYFGHDHEEVGKNDLALQIKVLTGIHHDSHEHMLTLKYDKTPYTCHGCHEIGFGSRYGCMPCNYHLHKDCALATPYTFHPFFKGCNFKFFTRPPGKVERCCDACGRNVQGFVYHCEKCGNDLHPCCAHLPRVIGDDEMKLHLHHKVESNCHRCGPKKVRKKERSWSYVSTCKNYCFHLSCVKDMLVEEWEKQYFDHDHEEVGKNDLALLIKVPNLQLSVPNNKGASGKFKKLWNILKVAIQVIISVLVGDPTALVGGLITSVITSAFSP